MSSLDSSRERLAGLTLDNILANQKRSSSTPPSQPKSQTLLDSIKEDESNKKDCRSWKAFKDKLRLKRAGSAWTSSIHIPTSDIPIPTKLPNSRNNNYSQLGRRNSIPLQTHSNLDMSTHYNSHQVEDIDPNDDSDSPTPAPLARPQFSRRNSTRHGSPIDAGNFSDNHAVSGGGGNLRPQLSRRNSTTVPSQSEPYRRGRVVTFRDSFEDDDSDDDVNPGAVRTLSAREAVAAQEATEAAAAEEAAGRQMTMSLMDLLEETDREMGLEGSRYILSDDEEEEEEEEVEEDGEDREGAMEHSCCVCMVKHKSAAFTPCGHTFCRMCSRELMVNRGNCPLCNNFILEILEIF